VRWVTPVNQFTREATRDYTIRGTKIAKGQSVCLFYASGNRDEDIFDEPFRFKIDRSPNDHIGFGRGEHVCLGAHLARLELRSVFSQVRERLSRSSAPLWRSAALVVWSATKRAPPAGAARREGLSAHARSIRPARQRGERAAAFDVSCAEERRASGPSRRITSSRAREDVMGRRRASSRSGAPRRPSRWGRRCGRGSRARAGSTIAHLRASLADDVAAGLRAGGRQATLLGELESPRRALRSAITAWAIARSAAGHSATSSTRISMALRSKRAIAPRAFTHSWRSTPRLRGQVAVMGRGCRAVLSRFRPRALGHDAPEIDGTRGFAPRRARVEAPSAAVGDRRD
jgi:hypothetical protein